jgi:hypothetical protein
LAGRRTYRSIAERAAAAAGRACSGGGTFRRQCPRPNRSLTC